MEYGYLAQNARSRSLGRRVISTLVIAAVPLISLACEPAPASPQFQVVTARSGLQSPTAVQFAGDGTVFVAERGGRILKLAGVADPKPVAVVDLSAIVSTAWDRGLLGLVVDRKYPERPYLYAAYSYDAPLGGVAPTYGDICPGFGNDGTCVTSSRVERITVGSDGKATERKLLISDWCQQFGSHSIGDIAMGPEGSLYVSAGDGASFENVDTGQFNGNACGDPAGEGGALRSQDVRSAADPTTLDGTVIRINPDTGLAWPTNPWASSSDLNRARIIAYGLRNPFRISLSPDGSQLSVADVGWSTWEEVNVMGTAEPQAVNFGWPCYEGNFPQPLYQAASGMCSSLAASAVRIPEMSYSHSTALGPNCNEGGSSVTGVAYYSGGTYPSSFNGGLFTADYSRKCIFFTPRGSNGQLNHAARTVFVSNAYVVDLQIGPGGDLFYLDLINGRLMRVMYKANHPPTPVITASAVQVTKGQPIFLSLTGSSDPDGDLAVAYAWDIQGDSAFNDGDALFTVVSFDTPGPHLIQLRARDSLGATATASITIQVDNTAPVPVIDQPSAGTVVPGTLVNFAGHATDKQDGTIPASRLRWDFNLLHCMADLSCHSHPIDTRTGIASGSFVMPSHDKPSFVEIVLTATDAYGTTASTTQRIDVG